MKKNETKKVIQKELPVFNPIEAIVKVLEEQNRRISAIEGRRVETETVTREIPVSDSLEATVKALQEQGRKISEIEEKFKDILNIPNSIAHQTPRNPVRTTQNYYTPQQSEAFWEWVDPICIACGAEYWSHSHEHGLCPKCAKKYRWMKM